MQELDELFVRNKVKEILREQLGSFGDGGFGDIMPPTAEQFYDTFIGPFVDVVKVANVAVKDIASATISNLELAITFDPQKQQAILQKFRADRQKYAGEMDKAMASTNQALSSPDAQLLMFMMNPGVYMGAGMAAAAKDTAEPVTEFIGGKLGAIGAGMGIAGDFKPEKGEKGPIRGVLDDLKVLFFGPNMRESLDEIDELEKILKEGDEEGGSAKEDVSEEEVQGYVDEWLDESGAGKKIEGYAKDILSKKEEEINAVLEERKGTIDALSALSGAKSLQELSTMQPQLQELGIDLTKELGAVEKAVQEQKDLIKAGGKEAEDLLAGLKKTPEGKSITDEAPVEEWFPIIEQTIIAGSFADAVNTFKEQSVGELMYFVSEVTADELKQMEAVGPLGKEYHDLIMKFQQDLLAM